MKKTLVTTKGICLLLAALFLLSLIPMLWIARYDHPCADDFSYGGAAASAWRETGSLGGAVSAAATHTQEVYRTWQGSFAAVFFMSLHPAIFAEGLYALVPVVLILGFVAAHFLLCKVVLLDCWGMDRYSGGIVALVVTFCSMQLLISPVEAFYWYNGAMYYTGFYSLALALFALVLLAGRTDKRPAAIAYGALTGLLGLLIGGGNFVTALGAAVVMSLFLAYRILIKKARWITPALGLVCLCASLLLSAAAPGNALRQQNFRGMNPVLAVVNSYWYGLRFAAAYVPLSALFALACLVPLLYRAAGKAGYSFRLPGLVTFFLYSAYASTFTPNLYAMSSLGMARVVNVNYYAFLLFLVLAAFYWCGWLARTLPAPKKARAGRREASITPGLVGILAACAVLGLGIRAGESPDRVTSVSAARSLATGEARRYDLQYRDRLALLKDAGNANPALPAFAEKPYVLYFDDITRDPGDWRNAAMADYYGKETVRLE